MSPGALPPGAERDTGRDAHAQPSDDERADDGPTDAELLAAHVAGDPSAFATILVRHRDRLWAVALRTTGDREEAADALQDAMVSAFRGAAGFRSEAAVTTWLHRVVVNACLDRMRRRRARPTVPLPDREPAQRRDDHALTDVRLDVRAALATLPEHQRQALVLVDMHGMSVAEAAEVLDVAQGTVKSRCARGRAALAPLLRPDSPAPLLRPDRPTPLLRPDRPTPLLRPDRPTPDGLQPGGGRAAARGNREASPVVPPESASADGARGHGATTRETTRHENTEDDGRGR